MTKNKTPITQAQIDTLYEWIKKVINSCDDLIYVGPCSELIDIFERRNPPAYLVNALRKLLEIHEASIIASNKKTDKAPIEDRIYELFNSGHSPNEISDMLSQKYHVVLGVINRKMKSAIKKSGASEK